MKDKIEEKKGLEPVMVEEEDRGEVDAEVDTAIEVVVMARAVEVMEAAVEATVAVAEDMEVAEGMEDRGEISIVIGTVTEGLFLSKKVKK